MKCTNCGLPLSPARTSTICLRCGTPISGAGRQNAASMTPPQQQYKQAWGNDFPVSGNGSFAGPTTSQADSWEEPAPVQRISSPAFAAQTWVQTTSTPPPTSPTPPPGQLWLPEAQPQPAWASTPPAGTQAWTRPSERSRPRRNTNFGFMVAGLCVITGGLILIFVYFMATSLQNTPDTTNTGAAGTPTAAATNSAALSPTAVLSPTPTPFPGQQYIDNAQTASAVDTKSGTPTQPAITFKVRQKIYVTFQVHPTGQGGAVCLLWYLNEKNITHYEFPVGASSTGAYSYATYGMAGPSYVEIYWASSTQCTDKILAQRVNFTVTN